MLRDERFFSRGNTAIAALVMITLIGTGAMVLDATRGSGARSQVAAAEASLPKLELLPVYKDAATSEGEKPTMQMCEKGFDYIIEIEKQKEKVSPTLNGKDAAPEGKGNQCPAPTSSGPYSLTVGDRTCDSSWRCRISFCAPIEILSEADKKGFSPTPSEEKRGVKCTQLSECKQGQSCETSKSYSEYVAPRVQAKLFNPDTTNSEVQKIKEDIFPTLDSGTQKGIDDAYKSELSNSEESFYEAERLRDEAQQLRDQECLHWLGSLDVSSVAAKSSPCGSANEALENAELKREEAERKYAHFASQSQPLADNSESLDPNDSKLAKEAAMVPREICVEGEKCEAAATCRPGQPGCAKTSTFSQPPPDKAPPGSRPPPSSRSGSGSGFGLGQIMPLLTGLLGGLLQSQNVPSCKITASPTSISEPGKPVTLSWTTENAQSASLSSSGQVGPTGSMTVNPQQTTTYTMQVIGFPTQQQQQQQQQYNQYGAQQGRYVWEPSIGAYVYVPGAAPQQQQGFGAIPTGSDSAPQQAKCEVRVKVGADASTGGETPKAQISCQPKVAEVGMQIAISFACQNSATAGASGFSTGGQLSGSATAVVTAPPLGSSVVTYGLTCSNQGKTDSAECAVNVARSSMVLIANPKNIVSGESANIGWITKGMERCALTSPTLPQFNAAQGNSTQVSGVVKSPPLTQNTTFVLSCTTAAGDIKTAETTIEVGNVPVALAQ